MSFGKTYSRTLPRKPISHGRSGTMKATVRGDMLRLAIGLGGLQLVAVGVTVSLVKFLG